MAATEPKRVRVRRAVPAADPTPAPVAVAPPTPSPEDVPVFQPLRQEGFLGLEPAKVAQPERPEDVPLLVRRTGAWTTFWTTILALDLAVLGVLSALGLVAGLTIMLDPGGELAQEARESSIYDSPDLLRLNAIFVAITFGLVPALWVWRTRVGGWRGLAAYMGLHRPLRSTWVGVGLAGLLLGAVFFLLIVLALLGIPLSPQSPEEGHLQDQLEPDLSWDLIVLVSVAAGVGEEILFRGVLIRWIGWRWQALLFGVVHLSSGEPLQFIVTTLVGLLFGWLRVRGWSLVALVVAHTVYDVSLLTIATVAAG